MKSTKNRVGNFNWIEIQEYYDSGKSVSQIKDKFLIGDKILAKARRDNLLKTRSKRDVQLFRTDKNFIRLDAVDRVTGEKLVDKCCRLYNEGLSTRDLYKSGITNTIYRYCIDNNLLSVRSLKDAGKLRFKMKGSTSPTEEARRKTSERQSLNNSGGRAKWFEVANQKVQGTWERDFAQKLEEYEIKWYKPKVGSDVWKYNIDETVKSYTPDLYLEKYDLFVEIKGYWWGNDLEKMTTILSQYKDKNLLIIKEDLFKKFILADRNSFVEMLQHEIGWKP